MEYEKMLERLYLSRPKEALMKERFELLEPEVLQQGNKTIVKNFAAVLKQVRREQVHLLKFLTKEFATPANTEEGRLLINTRLSKVQITNAFQSYLKQYVLCSVCGKPDTHFEDRQGIKVLKCEACGAHSAIKKL